MSGRMTLGSLFVLAALIPGICRAQGGYGYGPGAPPGAPPGAWSGQPQPPQPQYGGIPPQGSSNSVYEQLPDDLGFLHEDSPFETGLKNLFRHSYYRGEYLLWSATNPGNVLLGQTPASGFAAPTGATPIAPNTFVVPSNPFTGGTASAILPSLDSFELKNINGYRGTIGLPIGPGNVELSAFILGTRTNLLDMSTLITPEITGNRLVVPPTPTIPANFIGTPFTVGGVQQTLLYTHGYEAIMKTNIWGTEANFVMDGPGAGDFLSISPLIGFRYLNYRESLAQNGSYQYVTDQSTNPFTLSNVLPRDIYSQSNNNSYGPQFGVRAEVGNAKLKFGAEPKIMLGLNSYTATMSTINIPFDIPANNSNLIFHKQATTFSPLADLKVYSRIAISQYAHVFVAYNLMWVGSISRPYDSVGYNINSSGQGLFTPKFTDSIIQGLSVGGELRF